MTKTTLNFEVKPLSGKFGAEVFASHNWLTSEGAATRIISTLEKHGVLVFPQLHLSDDDFVTMTQNMGSMTQSTVINDGSIAPSKGLYRISLDKYATQAGYDRWNTVFPPRVHSLVWSQSNGQTSLLIGSTADHIIGMDAAESRALLDELLEWATQERFTYLHSWQAGDLVMFHNPALLHRSRPYDAQSGRVMHRTTLDGTDRIH